MFVGDWDASKLNQGRSEVGVSNSYPQALTVVIKAKSLSMVLSGFTEVCLSDTHKKESCNTLVVLTGPTSCYDPVFISFVTPFIIIFFY